MSKPLRIATRGSDLALAQAGAVRDALLKTDPSTPVELVICRTAGDRHLDVPLASLGEGSLGKGLFTREIEAALIKDGADIAVHSLKDLPADGHPSLVVAAIPTREHPADCLISKHPGGWRGLPEGATVATGSPRRAAQLTALRPDLSVAGMRGNVPTRLRTLDASPDIDAIVLARAGLVRLGMLQPAPGAEPSGGIGGFSGLVVTEFDFSEMLPAPGQGAVAIQCRADAPAVRDRVATLNDAASERAVCLERLLLSALGGGCHMALGTIATGGAGGAMSIEAFLFLNGRRARAKFSGNEAPESLAQIAAAGLHALIGESRDV